MKAEDMSDASKLSAEKQPELASRNGRALALLIDGLIAAVAGIPLVIYSGLWDAIINGLPPSASMWATIVLGGFLWFVLIHGRLLKNQGQTVGKWLLQIRICDNQTFAVPSFWRLMILRFGFTAVVPQLGSLGQLVSLVDSLFIFRRDRRCLHDLIARTRVVKVEPLAAMDQLRLPDPLPLPPVKPAP